MSLNRIQILIKHMAGKHDQKTHGRGSGGSGSSKGGSKMLKGARDAPHNKGWSIEFYDLPGQYFKTDESDAATDKTLKKVEAQLDKPLWRDPRTEWPSFTLYYNGEEYGGG